MATFVTTEKLSKLMDAVKTKIATKLDATGIKNDATTTDAGYVLDARMGKTLGDRATTLETKVSDLYFATDSNGKWGYKSTKNGAVTPFRNPTGDAVAAEVLSGKTFSSASLENATGTMTNRGAWTGATTGSGNVTIPEGYHDGKGYVSGAGAYNAGVSAGTSAGKSSAGAILSGGITYKSLHIEQNDTSAATVTFDSNGYVQLSVVAVNKKQVYAGRTLEIHATLGSTSIGYCTAMTETDGEDPPGKGYITTEWLSYSAGQSVTIWMDGTGGRWFAHGTVCFVPSIS